MIPRRRIVSILLVTAIAGCAFVYAYLAIVDPVTPIGCTDTTVPAKGANENAGGAAAIGKVNVNGGQSIPKTAPQGAANAAVCS